MPPRRSTRPPAATTSPRGPELDVIVVGARCGGAATAMLLARAGLRVAVVDRAAAGTDTVSTHALMRGGVLQLQRWGLLDAVVAADTPPVRRTTFHYGDEAIRVTLKPAAGVEALYAPRRTVLDAILVAAAADAGARVRHGVTVTGVLRADDGRVAGVAGHDDAGRPVELRARLVVGADGTRSRVARAVDAPVEELGAGASAVVYGRWSGVEHDGYEWYYRPGVSAGVIPTNGGEVCVFAAGPPERVRSELADDAHRGYRQLLAAAAPALLARLDAGRPPVTLRTFAGQPGYVRRSWGAGWVLVGDAGAFTDPISAHGITDALRDAELASRAIVAVIAGADEGVALASYQAERDRLSAGVFAAADAIATYSWDLPTVHRHLLALSSAMSAEVEALVALDAPLVGARRPA